MTAQQTIINIHGRRGGRGLRPWMLIPKVVAFSVYIGGLTTVLGLWIASDFTSLGLDDPRRALVLRLVGRLMVYVVVPALLVTIGLGIALLMQFPAVMLRMRWMQLKLASLMLLVPASHFFCETRFVILRQATEKALSDSAARQFTLGIACALIGSIWIVALGRLKPRFGQSPAGRAALPRLPPGEG